MGNARYDEGTFQDYSRTHNLPNASDSEVFGQRQIHESLDPKNIVIRESRDSAANPMSRAAAVFGDHTGSMGHLAGVMLREGIDQVMRKLYDVKPITDPHLMFGLFGDLKSDRAPLQVSQFEADIRIVEQLRLGYLEGNGGGNGGESASLPWYFMANHTSIDCWDKRQKKGFLFTYSDEPIHPDLDRGALTAILGHTPEGPLDSRSLLRAVSQRYEVFHLVVNQGTHQDRSVIQSWEPLLHNRVIVLRDHRRMPDVILATILACEGASQSDAVSGLDQDTRASFIRSVGTTGRFVDLT